LFFLSLRMGSYQLFLFYNLDNNNNDLFTLGFENFVINRHMQSFRTLILSKFKLKISIWNSFH